MMLAPFSLVTTFIPVRRIVLAHCHPHHHTLDDHGDALHSAANRMLVLRGSE